MNKFFIAIIISSVLYTQCSIIQEEDDDTDLLNLMLIALASNQNQSSLSGQALEFQTLVNNHRRDNTSCEPFLEYAQLNMNAQKHSVDMTNRNFFSHTNPDGKSPFDRMRDDGIAYNSAGENIAMGQQTAQAVLNAWLNSSGHRANINNCNFTHHGIGLAESSSNRWTHVFASNPRPR